MHDRTHMRVARPTDQLDKVTRFYKEGLGLSELFRFQDHEGFDGVMLGVHGASYHLEFTTAHGQRAVKAPTQESLLVFYLPDHQAWTDAVAAMKRIGCEPVRAFNPYWDRQGLTFEDPDGYRVVLQNAEWERKLLHSG